MLYIQAALLAAILLCSQTIQCASSENSGIGIVHFGKENLESIKEKGRVTLKGTQVNKSVKVTGSLWSNKATIGSVDVAGHAYISKSTVLGQTKVNGFFDAKKSSFQDQVIVGAQRTTFTNCKMHSILIKKSHLPFAKQVIELRKKSRCLGPITFESGKGRVILRDKSRIDVNKVDGAQIERHKK